MVRSSSSSFSRRALLAALASPALARAAAPPIERLQRRALAFPADFGAHPDEARVEWWYITGALEDEARAAFGFQVTFFRSRTDVPADQPSRFAAKQLVFAHAAVTDLGARRLRHDQRVARAGFGIAETARGDTDVRLHDWRLARRDGIYRSTIHSEAAGFGFELAIAPTQGPLLQGEAGWSRKGPQPDEASLYYSEPQLAVSGRLALDKGRPRAVRGRAWLDHEWSDAYLAPEAAGWDWIGMNLDDGSALMAFRMRRRTPLANGAVALWAGGSFRAKRNDSARNFAPEEVRFEPLRVWRSPASRASYPVAWRVTTPAGVFEVRARLDDQELDSRASTGAIYWEGLSDLLDAQGRKVGAGYLEMTGYAGVLRVG
jgi:predicted secreted hydrolase